MTSSTKTLADSYVEIWTDGSCVNYKDLAERKRKGRGGWAFIVVHQDNERVYRKGHLPPPQTNQTAEMHAVLEAMKWIRRELPYSARVIIHSDSLYVINGIISHWRHQAAETNFEGEANGDIWREIHTVAEHLRFVRFRHVKGHAGNKFNEMADRMASFARKHPEL